MQYIEQVSDFKPLSMDSSFRWNDKFGAISFQRKLESRENFSEFHRIRFNILLYLVSCILYLLFSPCICVFASDIDYYSPENILKFADYLYQQSDYERSAKEYERYMLSYPQNSDKALYRIGLCYRYLNNTKEAINTFQKIINDYPNSNLKFSTNYQISYSYFVFGQYKESQNYASNLLKDDLTIDQREKLEIILALNYLKQRQWQSANKLLAPYKSSQNQAVDRVLADLQKLSTDGINRKHKSRFLASLMSAIVPGTGKIYCEQYGNGFFSFITVGSTGFLAYRGFEESGMRSVKGWIFGSLFAVFYAGNIYCSGISALAYNDYTQNEIILRLPTLSEGDRCMRQ
jgi:tetratricopeptide (TPR) repeat protein